jgi:hypothetical protein
MEGLGKTTIGIRIVVLRTEIRKGNIQKNHPKHYCLRQLETDSSWARSNCLCTTVQHLYTLYTYTRGTRWRSWLRHCPTSRKAEGSIPFSFTGIFHWHNPSGHTMALGSTQPLAEMSTRNISWGVKTAAAYGWFPYQLHVPTVLKSGSNKLLEPSGSVQACKEIAVPLHKHSFVHSVHNVRRTHSKHVTAIVTSYIQHFTWRLEHACNITCDTDKVYLVFK